ncbi:hypothetical protein [Pseudomonas sp. HAR-UPW-AIA-41]|uniref:hypothetical protein n=1 Tax=Pseudomonas sp. HAR-UPW-AIA-41 TaxID=1985301 RepID=UPI001C465913|nr:hypothetical protein [Pseudomonas sp. HAR-UPW-AIA-41]
MYGSQECGVFGGTLCVSLNLSQGLPQSACLALANQLSQLCTVLLVGILLAEPEQGAAQQQASNGKAEGGCELAR